MPAMEERLWKRSVGRVRETSSDGANEPALLTALKHVSCLGVMNIGKWYDPISQHWIEPREVIPVTACARVERRDRAGPPQA